MGKRNFYQSNIEEPSNALDSATEEVKDTPAIDPVVATVVDEPKKEEPKVEVKPVETKPIKKEEPTIKRRTVSL